MVVDVLVDGDGRPRAAVIDFGGFLGVGSRKIAIDWELLQFRPADRTQPVRLVLGRAEVQAAPEYKPSGQPAGDHRATPADGRSRSPRCREITGTGVCRGRRTRTRRAEPPGAASTGSTCSWPTFRPGFGPFLAVYLTTAGWTQTGIGLALSLGTITAMASQVPAGALVDAVRSKSRVAIFSILAFTASALLFTVAPIPLFVYLGQVLHAFSSCTLGPAMVAMSLAVAGQSMLALRLGRNARFGAIGNAIGAALMGACGYYVSERAVFLLTAVLTLPAIVAILPIARFMPTSRSHKWSDALPSGCRERNGSAASWAIAGCSSLPASSCSPPWPTPLCYRWPAAPSPSGRPTRRAW